MVSVVVPLFNEEQNVGPLLRRLYDVLERTGDPFEVICIDDGSTDRTRALLVEETGRRDGLQLIVKDANAGQHEAIVDGFRRARGDWIVTLDGDLQNPPEEIPRVVAELRRGHDHVGTYRESRRDGLARRVLSRLVNRAARVVARVAVRDLGCMLRGYSRAVALSIAETPGALFVPALAIRHARNPVEIPVRHAVRFAGRSKYGALRLLALAWRLRRTLGRTPGRDADADRAAGARTGDVLDSQ